MKEAREIMALPSDAGEKLLSLLPSGGAPAARRYVLWAAWQQICTDPGIPTRARKGLFAEMCEKTEVVLSAPDALQR